MTIDIQAALDRYHRERYTPRGDEELLHVSDLTKCALEVLARREGRPMLDYPTKTLRLFHKGKMIEDEVIKALKHTYGEKYDIDTDPDVEVVIGVDEHGYVRGYRLREFSIEEIVQTQALRDQLDEEFPGGWAVGHPDAVFYNRITGAAELVYENKATKFWNGRPDDAPQTHHTIQAASYGIALEVPLVQIGVSCYVTDLVAPSKPPYVFDPQKYAPVIKRAFGRLREGKADPPAAWSCKYCYYGECEKNINPVRLEVPVA